MDQRADAAMGGISGDLCAGDPAGRSYVDGDCSLLRLHPGAAGSGNGPVFPAVSYSAGSPGSKAGESRDYFVGAGWCTFAGAAGIGSADGLR